MNRWLLLPLMALGAAFAIAQTAPQMAVYKVVSTGANSDQAASFEKNAKLIGSPSQQDGLLRYYNSAKLHNIPNAPAGESKDERGNPVQAFKFDFAAASKIKPFSSSEATSILIGLLRSSNLLPDHLNSRVSNTKFELVDAKTGQTSLTGALDTTVGLITYADDGNGVSRPVIGPGAKITARFAADGTLAAFHWAGRKLSKAAMVGIIAVDEAERIVRAQYHLPTNAKLSASLCYFAPPIPDHKVGFLYPHYRFVGTQTVGRETIPIRGLLLPAVKNAPQVTISTSLVGTQVTATAKITGGTGPFSFYWSSATSKIARPTTSSVTYALAPRLKGDPDSLSVRIEDVDGLVGIGSTEVAAGLAPRAFIEPLPNGVTMEELQASTAGTFADLTTSSRVGAEWIGMTSHLAGCQDLGGTGLDTAGFINGMAAFGVGIRFNYGELNAWETDFRSSSLPGGTDSNYVDAVDCLFYCGHANGNGWVMSSNHSNQFVDYNECRLGNSNLEWLCIAACGPLQTGVVSRWRNSFQGLHFLFGYATTSYDVTNEGSRLTFWCMGLPLPWTQAFATMRESWILQATEAQPSDVTWGFMQPVRTDDVCNWNDHYWGRGSTGPDIYQYQTAYYCVVRGSC